MQFLKYIVLLCVFQSSLFAYHIDTYNPVRDKENVAALFIQERKVLELDEVLSGMEITLDQLLTTYETGQMGPADAKMIVLFDDTNNFVGFCGYCVYEAYINYEGQDSIEKQTKILSLAIKQEQRNKGYASKLIEHMIEQAKTINVKEVNLLTSGNNIAAHHLYEKLGFSKSVLENSDIYYSMNLK